MTLTTTTTGEIAHTVVNPATSLALHTIDDGDNDRSIEEKQSISTNTGCSNESPLPIYIWTTHWRRGELESWTGAMENKIVEPYEYLAAQPGKDIRNQLLAACNFWLQVDGTALTTIGRSISMLHNASLMIDDIQDGSDLRRGQASAHTVYGIAQTINSANYAYFLAQKELLNLEQGSAVVRIFNEELVNLHRGQGMDIYWRDTTTIPTEDDYMLMVSNKTGGLFRLAVRLMQAVSNSDLDLVPLASLLGLIFQIRDDLLNLTSQPMASAKGFCDDLEEGKFSFPVIHAIRNDPSGWMFDTLKKRPTDECLKKHVVEYMTNTTKSMKYTTTAMQGLMEQMRALLMELGPRNTAFEAILDKLRA